MKPRLDSNISYFLPPALILATSFLVHFNDTWFYAAAGVSLAVILLVFRRAIRAESPALPRRLLLTPLVFLVGAFGVVAASPFAGVLFAVLGSYLLFHYVQVFPKNIPIVLEQTVTLYAAFGFSAFVWSLNYFFMWPAWIIMLLMAAGFWALFKPHLRQLGTLVSSLIMAEATWVLLFWPAHFFTLAVVSLGVFYLLYIISDLELAEKLTARKIYFQLSLISFIVLMAVLSSAWLPIAKT